MILRARRPARDSPSREGPAIDHRSPSVAVREKSDGAHRPSWRHGRRPLYVRGHRSTSTRS